MVAPADQVVTWLSAVALVVLEAPVEQVEQVVALVVQVVVREDPVDPAADRAVREDLGDFRVDRVVQAAVREDVAEEEGVAGVLQAVEHLTPRKSPK